MPWEPGKLLTLGAKSRAREGEPKAQQTPTTCILPVTAAASFRAVGFVYGCPVSFLLDTGSAVTLIRKDVWQSLGARGAALKPWTGHRLVGVGGEELPVQGCITTTLNLAGKDFSVRVAVVDSLSVEAILGLDFLQENSCTVDIGNKKLYLADQQMAVSLQAATDFTSLGQISVYATETTRIPAFSEMELVGRAQIPLNEGEWLVERTQTDQRLPVLVAQAVVTPKASGFPVRILNPSDHAVTLNKGKEIATMEIVQDVQVLGAGKKKRQEQDLPRVNAEVLWEMVERSGAHLSEREQEQLFQLLVEYSDIFASSSMDLGHTDKLQHPINTGDARPIRQRIRRLPPHRREEVSKLLDDMLKKDIIQPSDSPWASPIVLVTKKNGSTRFCVDYRKLNAATRKDAYPLPRIDDTLDTLGNSKWFSTLDLISGYWQVQVDPRDREKTAFSTPDGHFEFKVLPFGLCNAPATFQRLMDLVLSGLQWSRCLVYLDDVIIVGKDFAEHLQNLQAVFRRLQSAGLKLQPAKCAFLRKEVNYLGHVVSENGVSTDPSKTDKVAKWPVPNSAKDVKRFLGFASYYRRFIRNFATIAKPLHRLTERTAEFRWTAQCQDAFEELRRRLISAPVLAFPDFSRKFVLDTDASDSGIGAVLAQEQSDGTERVVAYASRVLSKSERRYCVTRRELLAVVTFVDHFRPYLLGRHFTVRTDHGALTWLQNFKDPEGQLARWLERLQEYDFNVIHRRGRTHSNADALSRLPCTQCGRESHDAEDSRETGQVAAVEVVQSLLRRSTRELQQLQEEDPVLSQLLKAKAEDRRPSTDATKAESTETRRLLQQWDQLRVIDGSLFRDPGKADGTMQWIVPRCVRKELL